LLSVSRRCGEEKRMGEGRHRKQHPPTNRKLVLYFPSTTTDKVFASKPRCGHSVEIRLAMKARPIQIAAMNQMFLKHGGAYLYPAHSESPSPFPRLRARHSSSSKKLNGQDSG
jgi:hypothetical protein